MSIAADDLLFGLRPAQWLWKPLVKRLVIGAGAPLLMRPGEVCLPRRLKRLGLYLHVPFCHNLCPYCPYHRVQFDESLYCRYEAAVHQEIDLVARRLAAVPEWQDGWRPQIVSVYIGGGTPTVVPDGLARIVSHLTHVFGPAGDVCVELHPSAMDDRCLELLRSIGVTMLSVGVESLTDRLLNLIGRSHNAAEAEGALKRAVAAGFDAVNVDLMFALPTQTVEELDRDLHAVLSLGVDQISTYPIFGFPYTEWGERLGIRRIRRPRGDLIRQMLALIRRRAQQNGFKQCAVWSFLRPSKKKFSSITRHHYLGFGPSAASMTGSQFYVNTFSLDQYASALPGRLPAALVLPVNKRLEMAYWLYWRAYEMKFCRDDFQELFGEDLDQTYGRLFGLLGRLEMVTRDESGYQVPPQAAYWIHRLQNEYSLNYINRLWGRCRREAWPAEVRL